LIFRYTTAVRRLLSLVLLAVFSLPLILPALALGQDPESNLPACCRRNGAHHCRMSEQEMQALLNGHHFTTVHSKCPLFPAPPITLHQQDLSFGSMSPVLLESPASLALKTAQIAAWARAAEAGARHKRGPPAILPS
jgi:hypothetical protein